jgi:hypothetical protein
MNIEDYKKLEKSWLVREGESGMWNISLPGFREPYKSRYGTDHDGISSMPFDNWSDLDAMMCEQLEMVIDPNNICIMFPQSPNRSSVVSGDAPFFNNREILLDYSSYIADVLDWLSAKGVKWKDGKKIKLAHKGRLSQKRVGMIIVKNGIASVSKWANPRKIKHEWPDSQYCFGTNDSWNSKGFLQEIIHEGPIGTELIYSGFLVNRIKNRKVN